MTDAVFAEPVRKSFLLDDETDYIVAQVRVSILGNEYFLDPDQANALARDLTHALEDLDNGELIEEEEN